MSVPADRLLFRALAAAAITLLLAIGATVYFFYALSLSCLVAALLGRERPHAFYIGAALLFAIAVAVPSVMDTHYPAQAIAGVAWIFPVSVVIGLAASGVVQLLRWIVRRLKA